MSYLALARRYRPRRFADVRGQDHVVRALTHALGGDRLHPAILLTGTRGVGKTTLGRIVAKGLNCEAGVSAEPCGLCSACKELDEGRFLDLIEIDAASRTKVDDTRQLLDNIAYAPVRGRYKVYLIDEVHMLSNSSFNALLKTLEEPPPHVKFILATTDPQKLPATVLSRCLQFSLKRLPVGLIREALAEVLAQESIQAQPTALAAIARAADGSMRDGLSLLDQAIASSGGEPLAAAPIEEMLGLVGRHILLDVIRALAGGDGDALLNALKTLESAAPDYAVLLDTLAAALQRIAVLQVLPQAGDEEDDPALAGLVGHIEPEDVQLYYQIAVHGRRDLQWAPDPRVGFEMAVLRMFAFRPRTGVTASPATRRVAKVDAAATDSGPRAGADSAGAAPAQGWSAQVERLSLDGMTRQLARHCAWQSENADHVQLVLDPNMRHLLTDDRRLAIENALASASGSRRILRIEVSEDGAAITPVHLEAQRAGARQDAAEAAVAADPAVRALQQTFDARVVPGSVRPLE